MSVSLSIDLPSRDCQDLYASHTTLHCSLNGCVPCSYKIGCFDVALDRELCRAVPNQRPELCPRARLSSGSPGTFGYEFGMNVLTVGDGDFSFSLAVARILGGHGLIATSYEAKASLLAVYPNVKEHIEELESLGVTIRYEVDATKIASCLSVASPKRFDRIVWNFPCEAISRGQDGQNSEMDTNKRLVRGFIQCSQSLLVEKGEIHINHKTKPPFNQWKIQDIAVAASSEGDKAQQISFYGRVCFDRFLFPPYIPRKALDRKSFPVHDACTFIFGFPGNSNNLGYMVAEYKSCADPKRIVSVDVEMIGRIRDAMILTSKTPALKRKRQSDGRRGKKRTR